MELFEFALEEGLLFGAYGVLEEILPSIGAVGVGAWVIWIVEFAEVTLATAEAVEGFVGGDVEMLGQKGCRSGGTDQVARAAFLDQVGEGGVEKRFLVEGLLEGDGRVEVRGAVRRRRAVGPIRLWSD